MTSQHKRPTLRRMGRGLGLGAAVTLAVGGGGLVLTSPANADMTNLIFNLSSEAVAVQSTATDPSVPLGLPFSVGSYGASSLLDSNGQSAADAGAPYSPLVSSLPNTGNGLAFSTFGTALPVVPTFPGYVSAQDPLTPLAKQNAGGYELVATADPTSSQGKVNMGGQASVSEENNAFAKARSVVDDDGLLTEAAAGVHALTLEGVMDLANFSSYASLTRSSDGQVVPYTRTTLGTISFAGLTSGLTGEGFTALGSAPTPVSADGLGPLNEALKPAGITLIYLPEVYVYTDGTKSTGPTVNPSKPVAGVVSGALQIFFSNTSDRGTSTETITIGRVAVNGTGTSVSDTTSGSAVGSDVTGATTSGSAIPSTALDAAGINVPGIAAGAAPGSGLVGAAVSSVIPTQAFTPAASFRIDPQSVTQLDSLYVLLAVAAGIALAGGQVLRLVAVKMRWSR